MASLFSISSLLQSSRPIIYPNSSHSFRFYSPRPRTFWRCVRANGESDSPSPPPLTVEKRSLAMATGEMFLGLASKLLGIRRFSAGSTVVVSGEEEEAGYYGSGRRVSSVVEEPLIWEQRLEDLMVERERKKVTSPGFSFSAAGLLFPYHLGVARLLLEKGYIKETTPLAGSSAGAIVCVVIASGNSMKDALHVTKILADDCRLNGTAFRLGAVLRSVLNEFLPEDVHIRSNGRVRVAITQLSWRPKGLLVDQFDSKEDLINAVITSSFIPGYLAPRPATFYRKRLCIDGGLTFFMPPTSASKTQVAIVTTSDPFGFSPRDNDYPQLQLEDFRCTSSMVRICAFPTKQMGLREIGISPDCNPENRASPRQLLNWALEPAEDDILDRLYELGYLDAIVWAEQNPLDSILTDEISSE